MKAHRSLRNAVPGIRGSVANVRREPSARRSRAQVARTILIPVLALFSFSAVAAASPVLGIRSHVWASTDHASGQSVLRAHDVAVRSCAAGGDPWMYARVSGGAMVSGGPWMYGKVSGGPWMYAAANGGPWMYAAANGGPWMYAVINGRSGCTRAGQFLRNGPGLA